MFLFDKIFKRKVDKDKEPAQSEQTAEQFEQPPEQSAEQSAEQLPEQSAEQTPPQEESTVEPGVVQAYEEYSKDNEDVTDIFEDNTEDERMRLGEDLEKFSEITSENDEVKAKLRALDSVGKDIDQELMSLLQADEAATNRMNSADEVKVDFVNEVTVYDTVERQKNLEEQGVYIIPGGAGDQIIPILEIEDEEPEGKNLTALIFFGICGILITLIIVCSVIVAAALNTRATSAKEKDLPYKVITRPQLISNNANYIYINSVSQLNGEDIMLQKMMMDSLATVFYFDKKFPVEDYNVTLVDNFGDMYGMDLSFYPFDGVSEEERTIIYFKPFGNNVTQFTLSISDRITDSKAEYTFGIDNSITPAVKYACSDEDFLTNADDVTALIQSAQFSSTGSTINFSFSWENYGGSIAFGNIAANADDGDGVVSLKQVAAVLPTKLKPNIYTFENENLVIGRMDFAPLKNLSGNVSVTFKDLMKKFPVNKEVNVKELLFNKEDNNIIINIGNYDLCLDRLIYDSNKFVLVVHAIDKAIPATDNPNDTSDEYNRVEVVLDVQLVAVGAGGMEIPIDGTVFSKREGSDIVFNVSNTKSFIEAMNVDDFKLDIKSASIKMDDVTAILNLDRAADKKPKQGAAIEAELVKAFESRLAYKSGEIALDGITGFSDELMQDRAWIRDYTPIESSGEKIYLAQVVTHFLNKDEQVVAVVQESWYDTSDKMGALFYRTHKVVCDFDGSSLSVVSDEIQK